jgi:hypothetical protein
MTTFFRAESAPSSRAEQAPRRGPVPLDPSLLQHVSGGSDEGSAPRSRWSEPQTLEDTGVDGAPRSRW